MFRTERKTKPGGILLVLLLLLVFLPTIVVAQNIFSFNVTDLEAYDRSGNWIYDADNIGFFTNDGYHFSFNPTLPQFQYYAEQYVHVGNTVGHETLIDCFNSTHPLAPNPDLIELKYIKPDLTPSEFELVSFRRVNTVDPLLPWAAAGQAGDVRVYSNAVGRIDYNGEPKLYLKNGTFEITTPYPNEASLRTLPGLGAWQGSIGSGSFGGFFQTGFGFGDLDTDLSDPDWLAPFAASNYRVQMTMINIFSESSATKGWFDFVMHIAPAPVASNPVNTIVDLDLVFPIDIPFVDQNVHVVMRAGVEGGATDDLSTFYVNEVLNTPDGDFPAALPRKADKYWQIGATIEDFNVDLRLEANLTKAAGDWIVVTRVIDTDEWYTIPDFIALPTHLALDEAMQAIPWNGSYWEVKNVKRALEFSLAAPDVPLPVTLASFNASLNAQNLIALAWRTASETSLRGFKVYYNTVSAATDATCLTPIIIQPNNTSSGANYSYVATDLTAPGVYYFWLEAISMDGSSDFFGPISKTINGSDTPVLPLTNMLSDAYPNPFRNGTISRFQVDIKAGEKGEVAIYNISGQLVKTIKVSEGYHNMEWDGKDSRGNNCSSGIYFYKLSSPSLNQTKKLLIFK